MSLKESARIAVKKAMGLKEDEVALVICDEASRIIGYSLYEACAEITGEPILIEMKERESNGEEPPELVAEALLCSDVALIPTTKSLSHTEARMNACKKGARIATLPGITEDIMDRTLKVDYVRMKELSVKLSEKLSGGNHARLITEAGTDLEFSIEGRKAHPDTGICHSPGDFSNLPAGESYIAPVEGTSEGKLVINGSLAGWGLLKENLIINIEDGYIKSLEGESSDFLRKIREKYGDEAWNIAELGLGTNPKAEVTGNVLEDEKVLGTIHVAFGDNSTFGGRISVDSHLDGVVYDPTLLVDGETLIDSGKILLK